MGQGPAYATLAGIIIGAHGVQGTLKLRPATATAGVLLAPNPLAAAKASVWIGTSPSEGAEYQVASAKRQEPKGGILLRLIGVDSRTAAEGFVGQSVYAPDIRRAPLAPDEYFVEDLIGLLAQTESGRSLGRITQVIPQPAGDIYETDQDALIPAVKEFVARVDLAGGRLVVRDIAGLLPQEQEEG